MQMLKVRHFGEYLIFQALLFIVRCLPRRKAIDLAELMTAIMTARPLRKLSRYSVASDNLRHAFDGEMTPTDIERTIRAMWRHLFLMICEINH
ncbi:MAG: lipid A biosynthesis acyltransferase, partial [Phycisphaerae bacterium]